MSPGAIVARAKAAGLDCIALSDHCCAANLPAFHEACQAAGMPCLYGIEANTDEDVHVLCLFDELSPALDFGETIYSSLQDFPNDPTRFGDQPIVNAAGEITGFAGKLLIGSTAISFFDLVPMVLEAGALCIPAHIDRSCFGALAHLGFLPDLPYSAVGVVADRIPDEARPWPVVRFSDAHQLLRLGRRFTEVEVEAFSVAAFRTAFSEQLRMESRP